jgi:hypothetical protein
MSVKVECYGCGEDCSQEPTALDLEYTACDDLVASGHAHWLRTRKSPGIHLTGKPIGE